MADVTSCLAVQVQSADTMNVAAAELLGLAESDFACPICMSMIKDPFVTDCGHSFCFQCITTHLVNKKSCPCCSTYMTADKVHPNFLLHKVTSTTCSAAAGNDVLQCSSSWCLSCYAFLPGYQQAKPG